MNYYAKFIPNLSTILQPLHELLQQNQPWVWTTACEEAFQQSKEKLVDSSFLAHYDYGSEKPIAFASRTLSSSERNYSQSQKEALGIIFGVKKFHQYLYGCKFMLETDHQPLVTIFGSRTGVPTLAAARLQRWAIILSAYQYEIKFRNSSQHAKADALSRLPVKRVSPAIGEEAEVFQLYYFDDLLVTAKQISKATSRDPVLSRVLEFTLSGWPNMVKDENLKPYFGRRNELSADQGCVLWGRRVVIPPSHRKRILEDLQTNIQAFVA